MHSVDDITHFEDDTEKGTIVSRESDVDWDEATITRSEIQSEVSRNSSCTLVVNQGDTISTLKRKAEVGTKEKLSYTQVPCEEDNHSHLHQSGRISSKEEKREFAKSLWFPFWLRKTTLCLFMVIFASLAVAVVALWKVDLAENGIRLTILHNEYSWKYGPTAVLVVFAILWDQVDKSCRAFSPWSGLINKQGGLPSLSIDYETPLLHTVALDAWRHRHIGVLAGLSGTAMLKMILTVSTGLLLLKPTKFVNVQKEVLVLRQYDPTSFVTSGVVDTHLTTSAILSYGHAQDGLPLRNGTTSTYAFEQPHLNGIGSRDYLINLPINVFKPQYTCVPQNFTTSSLRRDGTFDLNLEAPPCSYHGSATVNGASSAGTRLVLTTIPNNGEGPQPSKNYTHVDYYSFPCPEYLGQGTSPVSLRGEHRVRGVSPDIGSTDFFIASKVDIQVFCPEKNQLDTSSCQWNYTLPKVAVIACNANYAAGKAQLAFQQQGTGELQTSNNSAPMETIGTETTAPRFNSNLLQSIVPYMMDALLSTLSSNSEDTYAISNIRYRDTGGNEVSELSAEANVTLQNWNPFFDTFLNGVIKEEGFWQYNSSRKLTVAVETAVNQALVQWASLSLYKDSSSVRIADMNYVEDRLKVSGLSVWLMFTGFLTLAVICGYLAKNACGVPLKASPASIDGFVKVLADHDIFYAETEKLGHQISYSVTANAKRWYRPLSTRKVPAYLMLVLPLSIIGILEGLQSKSDKTGIWKRDNGGSSIWLDSWTHYLPTALMIAISVWYATLAFNVLLFSPFSKLKRVLRRQDLICCDLNTQLDLHALFTAVKTRQFGAALAVLGALFATALPIAVSGLYSIERAPYRLRSLQDFRSIIDFLADDGSSGNITAANNLKMMDVFSLTYPEWTYASGVTAAVAPAANIQTDADAVMNAFMPQLGRINFTDTTMDVDLPIYQPSIDCEVLSSANIQASLISQPASDGSIAVEIIARPNISEICRKEASPKAKYSIPKFSWRGTHIRDLQGTGELTTGGLAELHFFPESNLNETEPLSMPFTKTIHKCPSLAFMLATFDQSTISSSLEALRSSSHGTALLPSDNIKILQCTQKISVAQAKVLVDLPSNTISPSLSPGISLNDPPVPLRLNPSSAPPDSGVSGTAAFSIHLQDALSTFILPSFPGNAMPSTYDPFISALLYPSRFNSNPPSHSSLFEDPSGIFSANVNHMYALYTSQFLHTFARRPVTDLDRTYQVTGTVTSRNTWHIVQHRGPKIALQVLLLAMVIFAAAAYRLVDMRRTLLVGKHAPRSILGRAQLVVGSRWLEELRSEVLRERKRMAETESPVENDGASQKEHDEDSEGVNFAAGGSSGYALKLAWWEDREQRDRVGWDMVRGDDDGLEAKWGIDIVEDYGRRNV